MCDFSQSAYCMIRQSTDSTSMQLQASAKDEQKGEDPSVKSSVVYDWIETCLSSTHSIMQLPSSVVSSSSASPSSMGHAEGNKEDGRRAYNSIDKPVKLLEPVSGHNFLSSLILLCICLSSTRICFLLRTNHTRI